MSIYLTVLEQFFFCFPSSELTWISREMIRSNCCGRITQKIFRLMLAGEEKMKTKSIWKFPHTFLLSLAVIKHLIFAFPFRLKLSTYFRIWKCFLSSRNANEIFEFSFSSSKLFFAFPSLKTQALSAKHRNNRPPPSQEIEITEAEPSRTPEDSVCSIEGPTDTGGEISVSK